MNPPRSCHDDSLPTQGLPTDPPAHASSPVSQSLSVPPGEQSIGNTGQVTSQLSISVNGITEENRPLKELEYYSNQSCVPSSRSHTGRPSRSKPADTLTLNRGVRCGAQRCPEMGDLHHKAQGPRQRGFRPRRRWRSRHEVEVFSVWTRLDAFGMTGKKTGEDGGLLFMFHSQLTYIISARPKG